MILNEKQRELIKNSKHIAILQAENPDGDSIGSALALEAIFGDMGKTVSLHCPVQIPTYLRYIEGWDRVSMDFPYDADLAIIVDTSAASLMSKTTDDPATMNWLMSHPVMVWDHHVGVDMDLPFPCDYYISDTAVSTGELIFDICQEEHWSIDKEAAAKMYISIQADSLGLTTPATTPESFEACAELMRHGANPFELEEERRELMKKSPRILEYKGQLIERIEYYNDGRTAFVHVPFDEIHEYSNEYNPTMLVLDEMRLVIGVDLAIGIKTYPDGKMTGKVRSNIPISNLLAKTFGGDGHPYAAGFRVYEDYDAFIPELIQELDKLYKEYDEQQAANVAVDAAEAAVAKAEAKGKDTPHAELKDGINLGGFKVRVK